jgi:hypothetical protein
MRWDLVEKNWKNFLASLTNLASNLPYCRLEMIEIRIEQPTDKKRARHEIAMTRLGEDLAHWRGMHKVQVTNLEKKGIY